jgi:hypothetical protein
MTQSTTIRMLLAAAFLSGSLQTLHAQDQDSVAVRQKLEAKRYTFVAQTANPMRGRMIQLTSPYDLRISGDSVIAALPFFGRAYSAPVNPSDNGINFTSASAEYKSVFRKKRWEISIRPKDVSAISVLNLTVYANGRAQLQVTSNNRDPISFNGWLSEK